MGRVRLGVALVLPEPWRSEIDGLRRALGSSTLGRIPPHITLVPPINIRDEDVPAVLNQVREVAETSKALDLRLLPASTFRPDSPVLMLPVAGDDLDALHDLRARLQVDRLKREGKRAFVPHVTLHDNVDVEFRERAIGVLKAYEADVQFESVMVLRHHDDRIWREFADFRFESPVKIGTGGFEVSITHSAFVDEFTLGRIGAREELVPGSTDVFVARVGGVSAGVLAAKAGPRFQVVELRVNEAYRGLGIGLHLLRQAQFEAKRRGYERIEDAAACPHVAKLMQRFSG